ncbi:hypothetical protein KSX25_04500 [Acinetobacter baumannii]|nr:hypothetical protein [Acinetobacter baumannii]
MILNEDRFLTKIRRFDARLNLTSLINAPVGYLWSILLVNDEAGLLSSKKMYLAGVGTILLSYNNYAILNLCRMGWYTALIMMWKGISIIIML